MKSKRSPQLGQKPDVRPGRPPWLRPTGLSQRVQKRRRSGTLGSAMTTVAGSIEVMGAISTTPAPTRLRRVVPLPVWALRVVRRDTSTRPEVRAVAVPPAAGDVPAAPGPLALLGAMPQVSQ